MPIYEYQCSHCNHTFDLLQKVNDDPETLCPACGKESVVRLVSAAGFQLKGTGWYVTDFKDKPKSKQAAESHKSTSKPKEASKTDTTAKSKTKTESK